jgi:hypothetical protein
MKVAATFRINVILRSGRHVSFEGIEPNQTTTRKSEGVSLTISQGSAMPVTLVPPAGERIASIEYELYSDMKNYHKVIIPESGRWYINMTQMVSFWRCNKDSSVNDVKMPLYIFTGQDLNMSMAFGVVGQTYETSFKTLEPEVNRALIVYMRRLSMQIKRGTELYPIPKSVADANPDGSITEHLYYRTAKEAPAQPWLLTLRDFAEHQKRIYHVADVTAAGALAPLWCSWTDWFSDDVTDEVILRSVREGVALGIKNYIIDDGWFGPGLDNDYTVELNIGDWRPDPAKIKDMGKLVRDVKALGGVPMIWCAPHAVAPGASCFSERKKLLIIDGKGELVMTSNKFHSLCFMCPEARALMADICASFITEWDFEGAKYDLFNCVPNARCTNPEHQHDVDSMVEGLELTLKAIDERCRALKPNYIVELKQNYATPFLSRYGSMTRAGDTPYNTEGNYLRTLYVQGYSPYSISDYQTITNEDSPEDAACIVLKMIAAGIPTYSIDFDRLSECNKAPIRHYNTWYNDNIDLFSRYRVPLDGENNVLRIEGPDSDVVFLVNDAGPIEIRRKTVVLNGTHQRDLFARVAESGELATVLTDCAGKLVSKQRVIAGDYQRFELVPGGMLTIERH